MKREIAVIALLVVLALSIPALILYGGLSDRAEREWLERPWEGMLAEFQQEHIGLLNEAVQILWRHQEYFMGQMDVWDEEWSIYRESFRGEWRGPFDEAEWAVLQQVFGEQMCSAAIISWWHVPHIELIIPTTEDGRGRLFHIPAGCDAEDFDALLASLRYIGVGDVKKTAYPEWYAAEYREK